MVSKHRVYAWQAAGTLPANLVIAFARSDDYFFGVLHSCVHELWALRQGTQLEDRPRYTPTSCFETFPLPWAPGKEPTGKGQRHHGLWAEIGAAAKELDGLREAWLNPAEWIGAVERLVAIKYKHELEAVPADVRPLVRRSAVMAEAAVDKRLKVRTLTNLYNERPACLRLAHKRLDEAVIAAYAAVDAEGGWKTEWAEVYEAFGAGEITDAKGSARTMAKGKMPRGKRDDETVLSAKAAAREARGPVDERVLGNLLRMNGERAGK